MDRVLGDKCTAEVEVLADNYDGSGGGQNGNGAGDVLRLDQNDLETVVPKRRDIIAEGDDSGGKRKKPKKVQILKGKCRGKKAMVKYLDKSKYCANLKLAGSSSSSGGGLVLKKVP